MITRDRLILAAGVVFLPLALAPVLFTQPVLIVALACAVVVIAAASRSVAFPVALAGLPAAAIGITSGSNPFPPGAVSLFGLGWIALAIGFAVLRSNDELPLRVLFAPPVALTLLYTVWLLVRLGPSLDPSYGSRKLQLFIANNVALLIAGVVIARKRTRFDLYVVVALVMAIVSALALSRQLVGGHAQAVTGGRFAISASDSAIGLGRDAAVGLILAVWVLLTSKRSSLRLLALCAIPAIAIPFAAAGSRGPVLGLALALAVLLGLTLPDPQSRRRVLLVVAAVGAAVLLVPQLVPGNDVSRLLSIFSGADGGQSSNGRSHLWSLGWQIFSLHPLTGVGTGSFGVVAPPELYPHNLLLEAGAELGIVGLLTVAGVIASGAVAVARCLRGFAGADRDRATLIGALLAAAFVNAMVSGDAPTNGALWLASGLAVGLWSLAPAAPSPLAMMRERRVRRLGARGPRSKPAESEHEPSRRPARILSLQDGARIAGLVQVEVEPGFTGRPVSIVRLEWETGGEWLPVAAYDDRIYDVVLADGPVALVRSQALAEVVAVALGGRTVPSRRRPWAARPTYVVDWDTAPSAPAFGSVRAVSTDAENVDVESAPVRVELVPRPSSDGTGAAAATVRPGSTKGTD